MGHHSPSTSRNRAERPFAVRVHASRRDPTGYYAPATAHRLLRPGDNVAASTTTPTKTYCDTAATRRTIFSNCMTCCDMAEPRQTIFPNCTTHCDTAETRSTIFPNCTTYCDTAEPRQTIFPNCTTF